MIVEVKDHLQRLDRPADESSNHRYKSQPSPQPTIQGLTR